MIGYVKHSDSNKAMSLNAIDRGLLKRYIKVKSLIVNLFMVITINI